MSTPDFESMSDEEVKEYAEQQKEKLDAAINDELQELDKEAQDAFAALDASAEADHSTHEVELSGGETVEVEDTLPGELERKAANVRDGDMETGVKSMIDVMAHLIQTDGFDNPAVWEMFYEKYGSAKLMENAMAVTEPYYERQKRLQNQRNAVGN